MYPSVLEIVEYRWCLGFYCFFPGFEKCRLALSVCSRCQDETEWLQSCKIWGAASKCATESAITHTWRLHRWITDNFNMSYIKSNNWKTPAFWKLFFCLRDPAGLTQSNESHHSMTNGSHVLSNVHLPGNQSAAGKPSVPGTVHRKTLLIVSLSSLMLAEFWKDV